jgi:hypothetical protein
LKNLSIGNRVSQIGDLAFHGCTELTSVTLPNSLTTIGDEVFLWCTSLRTVVMGSAVTNISAQPFWDCLGLRSVIFTGNAPNWSLGENHFFDGATNAVAYYLPGTIGWTSTLAGRPTALWHPVIRVDPRSFGLKANGYSFNISGPSDVPIVVEGSTAPAGATWMPLQTFTLTGGLVSFTDPEWTNHPLRFYRIRSP